MKQRPVIALVDDEPTHLEVMRALARHRQIEAELIGVMTAEEALALASRVRCTMVLDLSLPRLHGLDLARQIRELDGPDYRRTLVACTALDRDAPLAREAAQAGVFDDLIFKDVGERYLAALLGVLVIECDLVETSRVLSNVLLTGEVVADSGLAMLQQVLTRLDAVEEKVGSIDRKVDEILGRKH